MVGVISGIVFTIFCSKTFMLVDFALSANNTSCEFISLSILVVDWNNLLLRVVLYVILISEHGLEGSLTIPSSQRSQETLYVLAMAHVRLFLNWLLFFWSAVILTSISCWIDDLTVILQYIPLFAVFEQSHV